MASFDYNSKEYFKKLDAYFRAANYLSCSQLYLKDNVLLRDHKLCKADLKRRFVGHWGTVPAQNFIYAHCSRVINKYNQKMLLISGPGHGGNFMAANAYLEGTYSEVCPQISEDKEGLTRLIKQFSFPYGIGSHCVPDIPGSIHEGGELGYSLSHAFGAVLDNPDLICACIVGDGEAETGPLATSWNAIKFISPKNNGAVLPIVNLNGYKIANPTVMGRMTDGEIRQFFTALGYEAIFVSGNEPEKLHREMARAMDYSIEKIRHIQLAARSQANPIEARFPVIVLKTPKGWTGPKNVNGKRVEGSFRAHQIPVFIDRPEDDVSNLAILENWLLSYRPNELFDENYVLKRDIKQILPKGDMRLSATPYANGGRILKDLKIPDILRYEVKFNKRGSVKAQDMVELSGFVRDIFKLNAKNANFRIFSPDEAKSNRLFKVFEVENRAYNGRVDSEDENLSPTGRVMDSYLSEHLCEGLLEGYILTGRHGFFDSYEAFIRVVDSMVSQHAKWLKASSEIEWRKPVSSLNLILTSDVWQQDHNGFTHQDPGFLSHLADKKPEHIGIYLPPDANTLIAAFAKISQTKNKINAIVASKQPSMQWQSMTEAVKAVEDGVSVWEWASMNNYKSPDVVLASAGHAQTEENLAAITILRQLLPSVNVKFVNVIDLMKLDSNPENPSKLTDAEFDRIFTKSAPVVFNFHGYPNLIKSLVYNRNNTNFIVEGYCEEGNITTAFDMKQRNFTDRFNIVIDIVSVLDIPREIKSKIVRQMRAKLDANKAYAAEFGVDLPEIANWLWE